MSEHEFDTEVERARQMVRDAGFMSAMQLTMKLTKRGKNVDFHRLMESIAYGDIHRVEYMNTSTIQSNRVKDLFYYNPEPA